MPPTIHLVRHAQGVHNLCTENESIPDPDLTPKGESQCADLRAAFQHHDRITRLVASPIRRTLYTCINGFGGPEHLYPVTALDVLQEVSAQPCDTGSEVAKVKAEFGATVNMDGVREGWTDKGPGSPFEPTMEKLMARGREARRALREIAGTGDDHIVAVAHGAILHFITDDWQDVEEGRATAWANCEFRTYQFVDTTGEDQDATLRETPESWRRRHGERVQPSIKEQVDMRAPMQKRMAPALRVVA